MRTILYHGVGHYSAVKTLSTAHPCRGIQQMQNNNCIHIKRRPERRLQQSSSRTSMTAHRPFRKVNTIWIDGSLNDHAAKEAAPQKGPGPEPHGRQQFTPKAKLQTFRFPSRHTCRWESKRYSLAIQGTAKLG